MKRILIIFLLLFIIPLGGCRSQDLLDNVYFDNAEFDSIYEFFGVADNHIDYVDDYYEDTNREPYVGRRIGDDDGYINWEPSEEGEIQRHEMLNYHMTDTREYRMYSEIYHLTEHFWYVKSLALAGCASNSLVEGEVCEPESDLLSFQYFVEGNNAFASYKYKHAQSTIEIDFLFIYDFPEVYLDFNYKRVVTETGELSRVSHVEYMSNEFEKVEVFEPSSLDEPDGVYKYSYWDFETGDYTTMRKYSSEYFRLGRYVGETDEFFSMTIDDSPDRRFAYEKYIRETRILSYYDKLSYFYNLNELPGWDRAVLRDDNFLYDLYYGNTLLTDSHDIKYERNEGEYIYFMHHHYDEPITDEILNLSIIGLDVPYDSDYFLMKRVYFETYFIGWMEELNINREFDDMVGPLMN